MASSSTIKISAFLPYLLVSFANIFFEYMQYFEGTAITKALLMPSLLFFLWMHVAEKPILILLALFFSWLGDLFLLKSSVSLRFMFGLGAFLVAHIFYITFFVKEIKSSHHPLYRPHFWLIFIFWIVMMAILMPNTGNFSVPVALYAGVILMMLYFAIARKNVVLYDSFIWVAVGAILFVLSDSMIAIHKFVIELPLARILIMATYLLGQGAIITGIIKKQ